VLQEIPLEPLLAVRREHQDVFDRFRWALRKAVSERLMADPASPAAISLEIQRDLIDPELARIRTHLSSANQLLVRKSGVSLGVGALVTTCGLLTGLLPLAALGIGAMATGVVVPVHQRLDKSAEVQMSDMYFLWQATGHAR
jgi:hypothetical protein